MYSFHKYAEYVFFKYFMILIFISRWQSSVTFCPEEDFISEQFPYNKKPMLGNTVPQARLYSIYQT